jgi:hypothetical protein
MLTILVNETKILFLRTRNPQQSVVLKLALLVAPGYNQGSGTIKFLKSKICAYYADHRSRLNTEARKYSEEYIQNNE